MSAAEALAEIAGAQTGDNPFKFLDYYDENDTAIFAGRAEELTTILAELTLGSTYVVYGRSGLGKTSIIKAGLFPELVEIGYLPIYVRILDDPEYDLCRAVGRSLQLEGLVPELLPQLLANVPRRSSDADGPTVTPVILVLDQFEEFFIRFRDDTALRKRFTELLGAIAREGGAAVDIIFSLREDYVAEMNDLRPQLPDILARAHRLLPLTAIGAREAILATLRAHNVPYDDAVPGLIVKELEKHRFSPLVLQIYCCEVYEAAKKEDPHDIHLRARHVESVGTMEEIYKRYLEAVTKGLQGDRALLACCMLDILRTAEETKRVLRVKDVGTDSTSKTPLPVYFNITCAEAEDVLNHLREKRVVRKLPTEESWYELLHDGIVPVLANWLVTKKEFRSFRDADRLVENIHTMEEAYLSEKLLRMAVDPFQRFLRLTDDEISFLFRSSVYEQGASVAYWAKRYDERHGEGAALEVVRKAIDSSDSVIAGVVAAGRLESAELAPLCLQRAIRANDPAVRRAAGAAYAAIGAPDVKELKAALRVPVTRRATIELLADLAIAGQTLEPFNRWTQSAVARVVKHRLLDPGAELIRNRTTIGLLAGLAGAILVLVAIFLPLAYGMGSITSPATDNFLTALIVCGFIAMPLAVLGAWIGRRTVDLSARDAVLNRSERWSDRAGTAWELEALTFFVAALWLVFREQPAGAISWEVHVVPIAVVIGFLLWNVRACARGNRGDRRTPAGRTILALVALGTYTLGSRTEWLASGLLVTIIVWSAMPVAIRLVERVADPSKSTLAQITFRIVQLGYFAGVLPLVLLYLLHQLRSEGSIGHIISDSSTILTLSALIVTVRASISAFALAWAQKQHPLSGEGIAAEEVRAASRPARALLTFGSFAPVAIWLFVWGPDSIPLFARTYQADRPIAFSFYPAIASAKYIDIVPKGDSATVVVGTAQQTGLETAVSMTSPAPYFAIAPKQPLHATVLHSPGLAGGAGTVTFRSAFTNDNHDVVRLDVSCNDASSAHLRGTGTLEAPATAAELRPFAVFINGNLYQITSDGEIAAVRSIATPNEAVIPHSISGNWTYDADIPQAKSSRACTEKNDRGVAFATVVPTSKKAEP